MGGRGGGGVFEGAVLSCTLLNRGGSLFYKYVFYEIFLSLFFLSFLQWLILLFVHFVILFDCETIKHTKIFPTKQNILVTHTALTNHSD